MKSSELRAILEKMEAEHGDIEVIITNQADHSGDYSTDRGELGEEEPDKYRRLWPRFTITPGSW